MKPKPSIATLGLSLLVAVLLLGTGLFPPARTVSAQDANIQMTATAAFDGYFKYGEWLPVWVELTNQGDDIEAEVRVVVSGSNGTLVFEAPVSLPTGSHKRLPVYVLPNNFARQLDIRLISKGKVILTQKASVHPEPNISYFVGLVAPERGAMTLLNGLKFSGQDRPKILVDMNMEDIPGLAEGLRSFDLIVFNDTDTSQLTPEQSSALTGWVQQGGHLVIGGGAGAQRTISGLPETLLPVRLQGNTEVNAEGVQPLSTFAGSEPILAEGPFVAARGEAQNARILAGDTKMPLVFERTFGSGGAQFVAFDLAGVPFNGWPGTQAFWQNLIGPSGAYPENMPFDVSPRQFRANSLTYPLSAIPSLDLPSIQNVGILLVVYILIVGPANYLVLRWRKKLHWAWFTIPAITIMFTAGAFGIGYGMRGTDLILNKIALVEVKPDGNASITSYMGLFSPRMQSYEVTVQGENLISPMSGVDANPFGQGGVPSSGGEMVFVQGQPSKVKGLTVNQWAMQSFVSEGVWQNFGTFSGSLRMEDEALVGKIRNDSQYTITDAVITIQSRFQRLGDLAPGDEVPVNVGLSNLQTDRFGPPLSYRLFQEQYPNGPMPRQIEVKNNIINSIFENGPWMKLSSSMRAPGQQSLASSSSILLFGWLDQAPPAVEVTGNRITQKTTALVYSIMDYSLPESGFLSIPPGMIPGSLVKTPLEGGSCGLNASVQMARGEAEFEFTLPESFKNYRANKLKLAFWRDNGNPAGMPTVSLWDWVSAKWVTIQDPILGTNIVQNAAPYISESGIVRVKISSESNTFGCIYLDLGMEAERVSGEGG